MMSAKTDIPNTSSTSPSPSPTTANSTVTTVTTSSPISESKPRRLPTSETYHYNVQHHLQHYENNNRFSTRQNLQQLKEQATSQNNNNNNNNTSTSTPMSYNSTPSTTITKANLDPVSSFPLSVPTTPTTLTTNTTTIINDNTKGKDKDKDNHNIDKEEDDIQQKLLLKEQSLNDIKLQCSRLIYELEGNNEPELIIKKYIQDLNKYNELKDLALQLITLIADQRKVKTSDILQEMNIEINNNE